MVHESVGVGNAGGCGTSNCGTCGGCGGCRREIVLTPPEAALLLLRRRLPKRVFAVGLTLCGVLFILVYFIRLAMPGEIVVFAPQEGLVWRLLSGLAGGLG